MQEKQIAASGNYMKNIAQIQAAYNETVKVTRSLRAKARATRRRTDMTCLYCDRKPRGVNRFGERMRICAKHLRLYPTTEKAKPAKSLRRGV